MASFPRILFGCGHMWLIHLLVLSLCYHQFWLMKDDRRK
uniref:Uncharacterized protein MANES_02G060600 n=1 Tax=Rhizophora mucronata TaxID=61149 RepID=A0A2P2PJX6_RHIMU